MQTATSKEPGRGRRKLRWYLSPRTEEESVIGWWEDRRSYYNLFLLLWAVLAIPIQSAIVGFIGHRWDMFSVRLLLCAVVHLFVQFFANLWYTGGWVVELLVQLCMRRPVRSFGPRALLGGTLFSFAFAAYMYWIILPPP